MPEVQFCTTERPQLFGFEVVSCRTCRLKSKKAILEVAPSNLENYEALRKPLIRSVSLKYLVLYLSPFFKKFMKV